MSLMTKIQEALAANPGVGWNDLVLRRLRTATSSTDGALNDLWMRWLTSQGYTQGGLNDRMAAYWRANNTPLAERNAFYFGYSAFFNIAPPDAPTTVVASPLDAAASVAFVPPGNIGGGPITGYRVRSTPGGIEANGASSPIVVPGLTNGLSYSFTVRAQNAGGFSPESVASNSVIPVANLVLNGGFATDTVWIKGTGWTIGSGVASYTGSGGANLRQVIAVTNGVSYSVTYTVALQAGEFIDVTLGGTGGTRRSASGTYVETIIAGVTGEISFTSPGTASGLTIDNVSVTPI